MKVVYSPEARQDLRGVWRYNVEHRSVAQANAYSAFLIDGIDHLGTEYDRGRPVGGFPHLLRTTLRRRPRGDGHIVVYEVDPDAEMITILHVFHTKQDVLGRLGLED